MKESLISALDFRGVGKMHRSPEDETSGVYVMTAVQPFFTSSRDNYSGKKLACEPGGGDSHMKQTGMLVVSLRGVNFGFWSRLGCSGQSANILSLQGLV